MFWYAESLKAAILAALQGLRLSLSGTRRNAMIPTMSVHARMLSATCQRMRGHSFLRGIILPVAVTFAAASFHTLQAQDAELISREEIVEKKLRSGGAWTGADKGTTFLPLDKVRTGELSRAVLRLSDKSELRLDELTEAEVEPGKAVEVKQGGGYFFSREKAEQLQIRTPAVNGALRGTQIIVRVAKGGRTTMTLLEGELALSNKAGSLTLRSGEQAEIVPGGAPMI